ncbi:hypothetical protein F4809DRAFT_615258 [Biscogniauxia mediterranea]|nr:hypothetical protein F4809DRAFT_615258 [Biscogniauxia mediterranea]
MPPRKSDASRKADVSMAEFVFDGDDNTNPPSASASASASLAPPTSATTVPPLKPSPSSEMDTDRPSGSAPPTDKEKDKNSNSVAIEDLNLPKSIITRLAKGVLPPNTQIQANAILAMSKSATVFINHLASAANEHTQNSNKKTIMPADVFEALEDTEFSFLRERLEAEFKKFNDTRTTKRNTYRRKVAAQKKAEKAGTGAGGADSSALADPNASTLSAATQADSSTPAAPRSKKQKPNAPDESAMEVDGDATEEPQDASDAETEPEEEEEEEEEEEDEEEDEEEEEEEEDEDEEGNDDDDMHDALEERQPRDEDEDDALDNGDESD